jgi:DNA-binding MarR family transcriptional regulator
MAGSLEIARKPKRDRLDVPDAWKHFVHGHNAITRQMDADLIAAHGLTLSDYGVLLRLSQAPERRLRRVDLAQDMVLSQSGITRLLDGLEKAGCVGRASCATDRRVVYAELTDAGYAKLREAARTHLGGIRALFESRFSEDELSILEELLGRLPASEEGECAATDGAATS